MADEVGPKPGQGPEDLNDCPARIQFGGVHASVIKQTNFMLVVPPDLPLLRAGALGLNSCGL